MSKRYRNLIYKHGKKGRYSDYKYKAKKRDIKFELDFQNFCQFWQKPCSYCGAPIDTIGLDRIDNTEGYFDGNIISCCHQCNRAKSNMDIKDFFDWCGNVNKNKVNLLGK